VRAVNIILKYTHAHTLVTQSSYWKFADQWQIEEYLNLFVIANIRGRCLALRTLPVTVASTLADAVYRVSEVSRFCSRLIFSV